MKKLSLFLSSFFFPLISPSSFLIPNANYGASAQDAIRVDHMIKQESAPIASEYWTGQYVGLQSHMSTIPRPLFG